MKVLLLIAVQLRSEVCSSAFAPGSVLFPRAALL